MDKKEFYDNSEEELEDEDEERLVIDHNKVVKPLYKMDPDHRSDIVSVQGTKRRRRPRGCGTLYIPVDSFSLTLHASRR